VRGSRAIIAVAAALVALVVVAALVLLGGGGDGGTTTTPAPAEAPGGAAPPSLDALPPEFIECMEDQGVDAESIPDQIHSPEGDTCFNSLHGGAG
jgi:hypothetical protein